MSASITSISQGEDAISKIEDSIIKKALAFINGRVKVAHLLIAPTAAFITTSRSLNYLAEKTASLSLSVFYKLKALWNKEEKGTGNHLQSKVFFEKFKGSSIINPSLIDFVEKFYEDVKNPELFQQSV